MTMHITEQEPTAAVERCSCCRLLKDGARMKRAGRKVCEECKEHTAPGTSQLQINKEHLDAWTAYERRRDERQAQDAAHIASLANKVKRLEVELLAKAHEGPTEERERLLQSEAVTDARRERDSARRWQSEAFQALWRIDRVHHAETGADCACRRPGCDVPKLLATTLDELRAWEHHEVQRARAGQRHGLPDEHPEARRSNRGLRR